MPLQFNELKATQAAAQLLKLRGQASSMSYMKLIKLLYLADREALTRWGRPITRDTYVSMSKGPVLSRVLDLITSEKSPKQEQIWSKYIGEPKHYTVRMVRDPGDDQLSKAEVKLLDEIFETYGHSCRWDLVERTHAFGEWQDPGNSSVPITYRAILKGVGKTDKDREMIEAEIKGVEQMDEILGKA